MRLIENFQITDNGFSLKDKSYAFNDVKSIFVNRIIANHTTFGITLRKSKLIDLNIYLFDGNHINFRLDENALLHSMNIKSEDFNEFEVKYKKLMDKTFKIRIQPYIDSLKEAGFFKIEGIEFYPGEKIRYRNNDIPISDIKIYNFQGSILLNKIKKNNKNIKNASTQFAGIILNKDPDVILALIEIFRENIPDSKLNHINSIQKSNNNSSSNAQLKIERGSILLNKYRVSLKLGEGAFGKVFKVEHLILGASRAVKIISSEISGITQEAFEFYSRRFKLEAQIGATIENDNVVRVYDYEETENTLFLIMENVVGGSLLDKIIEYIKIGKHFSVLQMIELLIDCCNGLSAIHSLDIVHRDIKPANILIDSDGHAKISDLGIAQTKEEAAIWLPSQKHPGTKIYMSPEQVRGGKALDLRSDIYSLGLVFIETATLRRAESVLKDKRFSSIRPDIPEWFKLLVLSMISYNPSERPQNCESIIKTILEKQSSLIESSLNTVLRYITLQNIDIPFVKVEGGMCIIGANVGEAGSKSDEAPLHEVNIRTFWISKYPISTIVFSRFMRNSNYKTSAEIKNKGTIAIWQNNSWKFQEIQGANWVQPYGPSQLVYLSSNLPVTMVSWDDTQAFCTWMSKQINKKVRLPSEVEWEKAASGKSGDHWPWGKGICDRFVCNYYGEYKMITPSDKFSPRSDSKYGCSDMLGNIWEWTQSKYRPYPYNAADGREEISPSENRVLRGGSCLHYPRITARDSDPQDAVYFNDGFRIVIEDLELK